MCVAPRATGEGSERTPLLLCPDLHSCSAPCSYTARTRTHLALLQHSEAQVSHSSLEGVSTAQHLAVLTHTPTQPLGLGRVVLHPGEGAGQHQHTTRVQGIRNTLQAHLGVWHTTQQVGGQHSIKGAQVRRQLARITLEDTAGRQQTGGQNYE